MRNHPLNNRRSQGTFHFTAKKGMALAGIIGLAASIGYWWSIQSLLTPDRTIAAAMTMIMALAPSALAAFLFPWSPAGMFAAKNHVADVGVHCDHRVDGGSALLLLHYDLRLVEHPAWYYPGSRVETGNRRPDWIHLYPWLGLGANPHG